MRDDLESIGYLLIYFLKGKLPWMGIESKDRNEQLKSICIKKIETSSCDLCAGLPKEFVEYIDYCKDLEYGQKPDYTMLKNIFLRILRKIKEKFDYIYDWNEDDKNSRADKNTKEKESADLTADFFHVTRAETLSDKNAAADGKSRCH